jgi:hypothetical protein
LGCFHLVGLVNLLVMRNGMTLDTFVSEQELKTIEGTRQQKRDLIAQMPNAKLRRLLDKNFDLSLDKIAEIFTAMAKDLLVVNKDGYDFTTRSGRTKKEHKFATLSTGLTKQGYVANKVMIGNLLSKNCDLIVLVDMGGYLKYFEFPVAVWKAHWPNKKGNMSIGKGYPKSWYCKYEVSKEKFFSGNAVWNV